jgi:hypothetical protein
MKMLRLAGVLTVAAWLAASLPAAESNTLTADEAADGWKLLFDGQSLKGWRSFRTDTPGAGWRVADGVLVNEGKTGDLMTTGVYGNFELSFEWKISAGGSSGVIYRLALGEAAAYRTGPEYQILDNAGAEDNQRANHLTGAIYDVGPGPARDVTRPVGEWNTSRIVVRAWRVEHWLNGEKLIEFDLASDAGRAAIARSQFREWTKFATMGRGFIALQDGGTPVSFRNLKIRDL